jgi:cyanophycinase
MTQRPQGPTWAFLGSGEFQTWHDDVDKDLLADRAGYVLVIATASAPEGEDVYQGWREQGLAHYARLGIDAVAPDLRVRTDAFAPEALEQVRAAALVFFSGGNPAYLASVLADSPFWSHLQQRLASGELAYAGCSAGVAALSDPTFDSSAEDEASVWAPGLGHFPGTLFAPHWDAIDNWRPNAREFIAGSVAADGRLVALDEETAMVGDGQQWRVSGASSVHTFTPATGEWCHHRSGSSFVLALRDPG